jgi:hypothetical protein
MKSLQRFFWRTALTLVVAFSPAVLFAQHYIQTNLVSDLPGIAKNPPDIRVPLSLEPKRTLSPNRPKEFFRCVRNAKRAELPPQDRIGHRKMIASEHIEMLIC